MSARKRLSASWMLVGLLILLVAILLVIGLFAVSYRLGLALLIGAGAALLILGGLVPLFRGQRSTRPRTALMLGLLGVLVVAAAAVFAVPLLLQRSGAIGPQAPAGEGPAESEGGAPRLAVSEYRVVVLPGDERLKQLEVFEEITADVYLGTDLLADGMVFSLPPRTVEAVPGGFLLAEARLDPPGTIEVSLSDGSPASGVVCSPRCPLTRVELRDFPRQAFFAARDAGPVEIAPYLDTEIVRWSVADAAPGIVFAFMPPPFQHLRPLLAPLVGASDAEEWVVGLIGVIGTIVMAPLIRPILTELFEEGLTRFLRRLLGLDKERSTAARR
ncbi:MAG: hypothetical protein Kow00124_15510 [Anaerolineae bacterium]